MTDILSQHSGVSIFPSVCNWNIWGRVQKLPPAEQVKMHSCATGICLKTKIGPFYRDLCDPHLDTENLHIDGVGQDSSWTVEDHEAGSIVRGWRARCVLRDSPTAIRHQVPQVHPRPRRNGTQTPKTCPLGAWFVLPVATSFNVSISTSSILGIWLHDSIELWVLPKRLEIVIVGCIQKPRWTQHVNASRDKPVSLGTMPDSVFSGG